MSVRHIAICLAALALLSPAMLAEEMASPVKEGNWVADQAEMLSAEYRGRIKRFLLRLNRRTEAQVVVVTTPRVDAPMAPRAFAVELFKRWGLGRAKANDGVLLFVSRDDRAVEIVTGSGLTAQLPNSRMQTLVREKLLPGLARGDAGATLLDGVKDIGATLAGIDRTLPPLPEKARPFYLYLTIAGAVVGLSGFVSLLRFWLRPLPLPPTGRRQEKNHWADGKIRASIFAKNKVDAFFEQQAFSLLPKGWREYPPVALWETVAGFTLLGSGGVALLLAAFQRDMEVGLWNLAALVGVCSSATLWTLPWLDAPPKRWSPRRCGGMALRGLAIALAAGLPLAYAAAVTLWSDRELIAYVAPVWVLLVNAGIGVYLASELRWEPRRTGCELCHVELRELEQEALPGVLETWEQQARKTGAVYFRGWRCPSCHPKVAAGGVYLVYAVDGDYRFCDKCKRPAIARNSRGKWLILQCVACGHEKSRQPVPVKVTESWVAGTPAASYESGAQSDDDDHDDHTWYDSGGSSIDTGGGSTDGGGAGGTW